MRVGQVYEQRAADEKAAFIATEATNSLAADAAAEGTNGTHRAERGGATVLPLSRVKRIAKLDPDTGNVGMEATLALTLAAEMFVELLVEEAAAVTVVGLGRCC